MLLGSMKIAYLMLVHRNPQLLARVIRALSSEECGFFIHIDRKSNIENYSKITDSNVFFCEPRTSVYWGEFSQVEATVSLIKMALCSESQYEYFVFLQGSDYPLRSSSYIQRFFEENRGFEFISLAKMPAPGFPMSKINKLRYPSDRPILRLISRGLAKLGLASRDYRKSLGDLQPYAGDACWVLSRSACEYILEYAKSNPQIEKFFRNSFTSDEMFFHTIIGNSAFSSRVRRNLNFRDWPEPGNHPNMLSEANVKVIEAHDMLWVEDAYGGGEALFARKFSDDNLELVDRIDNMIRQKEGVGHKMAAKPRLALAARAGEETAKRMRGSWHLS
jgi:hypothetical protein